MHEGSIVIANPPQATQPMLLFHGVGSSAANLVPVGEALAMRMVIAKGEYALEKSAADGWRRLAVLPGGAGALLPSALAIDEGRLEMAIEAAEDWSMPHAAGMRGEVLEVADATGRLRSGMEAVLSQQGAHWSVADLEDLFLRLVDLATGRVPSGLLEGRHAFVADLLLLRELAHHGQVQTIRLVEGSA